MAYPLPELLPQLQILCTPEEYLRILGPLSRQWGAYPYAHYKPEYWRILPDYTYAYCPLCQFQYREPADTYSLRVWGGGNHLQEALFGIIKKHPIPPPRCLHFLGIAEFCNLHGQTPKEFDWFQQETGELPIITRALVPDNPESYVVLHALPICRIEGNQFVPRYTVFIVTYFSADPERTLEQRYLPQFIAARSDPEFYPATLDPIGKPSNLVEWAASGKMGWLDLTRPDLPLCIGKDRELPPVYRNIQGESKPYRWRKPGTKL